MKVAHLHDSFPNGCSKLFCVSERGNIAVLVCETALFLAQFCDQGSKDLSMSNSVELTGQDVCKALGVKKHILRRWTENLPVFLARPSRARSARRYAMVDLLLLSAIMELEGTYGLALETIARFDGDLYQALEGEPNQGLRFLFLDLTNQSCYRLDSGLPPCAGIVLDLDPVFRRVAAAFAVPTPFPELPFAMGRSPVIEANS